MRQGEGPQVQTSEQALGTVSPDHAGRNIGLCNGKLSTMSGEEVESMEQSKLADRVGKVGSSWRAPGRWWRGCVPSFLFMDSALSHVQVSVFFRTSPKHKLKIIKVSCVQGQVLPRLSFRVKSRAVVTALLHGTAQGPRRQKPRHPQARAAFPRSRAAASVVSSTQPLGRGGLGPVTPCRHCSQGTEAG